MKARWILLAIATLFASGHAFAGSYDSYGSGGYYDDNRYDSRREVSCESVGNRTEYCNVDTRGGVRLLRQTSRAACIEGSTWGWDRRGIWVANGCRAQFAVFDDRRGRGRDDRGRDDYDDDDYRYGQGGGYYNDNRYGRDGRTFTCESRDGRYNYCSANTRGGSYGGVGGGIRLRRQLSKAACIEGSSWGADQRGVWVSNGCRGEFEVDRSNQQRYVGVIRCDSNDGRYQFCAINSGGYNSGYGQQLEVRLRQQYSRGACIQNHSWGFDHRGIWVSNGCRAEFDVYTRGGGGRRW
jgi:hypothetical protein